MILGDFFATIFLIAVRGGKINMGPLSGKFVSSCVELFSKYCPGGRYWHFQVSSYFFYCDSLTYEAQRTFPSFDSGVLLSFAF